MKHYSFTHLVFGTVEHYAEDSLPDWLKSKHLKWFLEGHVQTLEVGGSVDTDFRKITRTA